MCVYNYWAWVVRMALNCHVCVSVNIKVCDRDTCIPGSQGVDCGTVLLRPCTTAFRHTGDTPIGHIDDEGRDLNWRDEGYTESRCTGSRDG